MLEKNKFELNKQVLCVLHAEVAREEALQWGEFRDGNLNIGGTDYLPPAPDRLNAVFAEAIREINQIHNPIVKALSYFLFGARTQFFLRWQ